MKKTIYFLALIAVAVCVTLGFTVSAFAASSAPATTEWNLTRATVENTDGGVVIKQTEMGTPDNHAIAILETPFNDVEDFEITLRINMEEFVASGYARNDVWAGVGFMGKPTFINWRNSEQYGWAKDSPGIFMRFMNYSGDLGWSMDVYQENYHTLGDESGDADIVDTWHLGEGNADCKMSQDITIALKYDEYSHGKEFYRVYINGENITQTDEAAHVEKDVVFADGKLYLLLVMNTQDDEMNSLSRITVKSVNGVSYCAAADNGGTDDKKTDNGTASGNNKSGCSGAALGSSAVVAPVLVLLCAAAFVARGKTKENL